ncbi:MAG: hypothetical protein ACD_79C00718G0004 [uncultured bacterium]|nr:MAG: hypothetical protein ACD_79C00718G0004 [uncultured bacterium]
MRLTFLIFLLSINLNIFAGECEILSVTRDFEYNDIFKFKEHLIDRSSTNKFDFGDTITDDKARPEFFIVKFKVPKKYIGQVVSVIFNYKTSDTSSFQTIQKEVVINSIKNKAKLQFSGSQNAASGRVELWDIKIIQDKNILAEKKSPENKWR